MEREAQSRICTADLIMSVPGFSPVLLLNCNPWPHEGWIQLELQHLDSLVIIIGNGTRCPLFLTKARFLLSSDPLNWTARNMLSLSWCILNFRPQNGWRPCPSHYADILEVTYVFLPSPSLCRPSTSRDIQSVWIPARSQWHQELFWKRYNPLKEFWLFHIYYIIYYYYYHILAYYP